MAQDAEKLKGSRAADTFDRWRDFLKGLGLVLGIALASRAAAQDHQYSAEQIQAGYRIYASQCQLCHGFNGDGIARVNLARQQFPHAVTDEDIRKVITTGNAAGMPPFALKVSTSESSSSVTLDFSSVVAPRVPLRRA